MIRPIVSVFMLVLFSSVNARAQEPSDSEPGPINEVKLSATTPKPTHPKTNLQTAVDPVTSVPSLAFATGIASPSVDLLAASLVATKEGTSIRGVFAPFAFIDNVPIIIADTRIEIRGQSDFAKPWGLSLSTGYNSRTTKLREILDAKTLASIRIQCQKPADPVKFDEFKREVKNFADMVNGLLPDAEKVNIESISVERAAVRITVIWNERQGRNDLTNEQKAALTQNKAQIDAQAKKVSALRIAAIDTPTGDCVYKDYSREQAKRAYSSGWSIRIEGNMDAFPYVDGPKIRADDTKPFEPPVKHAISGFGGTLSLSWFPSRDSRLSLNAAYSAKRAKPDVESPQRRLTLLIETAVNKGFGDIETSGFQKGIAAGFQFGVQNCLEDGGCDDPVPYYDKSKTSRTVFVGGFLDLRPDEKIQLRIGVPLTIYSFATPPANTDGGTLAWSLSPTVSLTTTKWVL